MTIEVRNIVKRYGSFAALESGADTISVAGVVIVSGALAAAEAGSDTMQTDTGEGYPSSVTITVPAGTYDLEVRVAGTATEVLQLRGLALGDGVVDGLDDALAATCGVGPASGDHGRDVPQLLRLRHPGPGRLLGNVAFRRKRRRCYSALALRVPSCDRGHHGSSHQPSWRFAARRHRPDLREQPWLSRCCQSQISTSPSAERRMFTPSAGCHSTGRATPQCCSVCRRA